MIIANAQSIEKKYKLAEDHYRQAIKYYPDWVEAYDKLIQALQNQNAYLNPAKVCEDFIQANPNSDVIPYFRNFAVELNDKACTQEQKNN
jgi:hypothetical protein